MLRIAVLALLVIARTAVADDLTISDLEDDAKRVDQRTLPAYDRALENRDIFATLHDSVHHPAYKELKASRARYEAAKAAYKKAIQAKDIPGATKALEMFEAAGEEVSTKVEVYANSSQAGVEKIQIGLGVLFFLVAGLVWLLFRRRKKPPGR
jgi:hypothetical protein